MARLKRMRTTARTPAVPGRRDVDQCWRGSSEDGLLAYSVTRTPDGVHVERTHVGADGSRSVLSSLFLDADRLGDWCDSDDLRFEYVHLCSLVKRKAIELLDQQPVSTDAQSRLRF